jgi:hypothetical protein
MVERLAMLYVGCSNCRSIGPLWCAGQMMPHYPMAAEPSAWGPACGFCGVMPPYFTCMNCRTTQWLYLQGTAVPQQATMPGQMVAPVIQAAPNAQPHELKSLCADFASSFLKGMGNQLGQSAAHGMSGWMAAY